MAGACPLRTRSSIRPRRTAGGGESAGRAFIGFAHWPCDSVASFWEAGGKNTEALDFTCELAESRGGDSKTRAAKLHHRRH